MVTVKGPIKERLTDKAKAYGCSMKGLAIFLIMKVSEEELFTKKEIESMKEQFPSKGIINKNRWKLVVADVKKSLEMGPSTVDDLMKRSEKGLSIKQINAVLVKSLKNSIVKKPGGKIILKKIKRKKKNADT